MQRHIALYTFIASVASGLAGCSHADRNGGTHSGRAVELFGPKAAAVLNSADRVEPFRIKATHDPSAQGQTIVGYPILHAGKEQGKPFASHLSNVLLSDRSYEWDMAKGCTFNPGVAYRVWSGSHSIVVLVCFSCDEIQVIPEEANPESHHYAESDPAHAALLKLAKEALPDSGLPK